MNSHVPPGLEAKLNRLAANPWRDADRVAVDSLSAPVEHDEWGRQEVEIGRASAREGRLLDHGEAAQ